MMKMVEAIFQFFYENGDGVISQKEHNDRLKRSPGGGEGESWQVFLYFLHGFFFFFFPSHD